MRTLIVLSLVAAVCADESSYNYQPVQHPEAGFALASVAVSNNDRSPTNSDGFFDSYNDLPSATNQAASPTPKVEIEKEIFTFSASEDDFSEPVASKQYENSVKQGLRVIFIKGPENNDLQNAAVTLAKHVNDQKTAIYVLQKQADLSQLENNLNIANHNHNSKPEVHFVQYRTPEDADNAQKAIQDQYASLSGPFQFHNGGVAPVLSFVSKDSAFPSNQNVAKPGPAVSHDFGASNPSSFIQPSSAVDEPSNNYLPPSILRLFRL